VASATGEKKRKFTIEYSLANYGFWQNLRFDPTIHATFVREGACEVARRTVAGTGVLSHSFRERPSRPP